MCFSYDDEKEWIHVKFLYDSGSGEFFFYPNLYFYKLWRIYKEYIEIVSRRSFPPAAPRVSTNSLSQADERRRY